MKINMLTTTPRAGLNFYNFQCNLRRIGVLHSSGFHYPFLVSYAESDSVKSAYPWKIPSTATRPLHYSGFTGTFLIFVFSYDGRVCGDARSAYSSGTQPGFSGFSLYSTKSSDFRRPYLTRPDFPIPDPRVYGMFSCQLLVVIEYNRI